ncbi:MAG: hypothetical protein A2W85_04780 [Bacteroidetes bacterium GWF2_41_31]|nr:MAG: hypothetical protein A2W85_04780 [Bacteroidetes bacterium GWF2_41_31]
MKKEVPVFTAALLLLVNASSFGQCCAAGNPITADGSASGGGKNILEISALYKHSYSDTYFYGSERSDYKYIDYSYFDFNSFRLAYGITSKIKLSAEIGYFFSKSQTFNFGFNREAKGLGDGVLEIQYDLYKNPKQNFDVFTTFRVTLPIGEFDQMNGPVVLPIDIQPSSGGYKYNFGILLSKRYFEGKILVFVDGSCEISQRIQTNRTNYKYGNLYNASIFGSYKLWKNLIGVLQVRSQIRDRASDKNHELVQSTGGHVMFVVPQLRVHFLRAWNASFIFEYPIYKNMNGKQLTNKYAYSVGLSHQIDFKKSH